jgi:hypothetical protein
MSPTLLLSAVAAVAVTEKLDIAYTRCAYQCPEGYAAILDQDSCVAAASQVQPEACSFAGQSDWSQIIENTPDQLRAIRPHGCYIWGAAQGGCGLRINLDATGDNTTCGERWNVKRLCRREQPRFVRAKWCEGTCPQGYRAVVDRQGCLDAAEELSPEGCASADGTRKHWPEILKPERKGGRPNGCYLYQACQGGCGLYLNNYTESSTDTCGACFSTGLLCELEASDSQAILSAFVV